MNTRKLLARMLLACTVIMALGGCTRGMSDLREWVAQEKAQKGPPLPPLPVIKTFESFTYNDQNLRDPFSPSPLEAGGYDTNGPRPDANRPKQPLEMFPLDALKMVGTIGTGAGAQALIKDPTGVIHRVVVGNYMGQSDGRVTKVTPDQVDLTELVPNGNGGWMERKAEIAMSEQ